MKITREILPASLTHRCQYAAECQKTCPQTMSMALAGTLELHKTPMPTPQAEYYRATGNVDIDSTYLTAVREVFYAGCSQAQSTASMTTSES